MSAIANQPSNKNFLSPLGFKFFIKKTPNTNWFVQAVNLPTVTLQNIVRPTPFTNIHIPGDHMQFENLQVTFRVDEDMQNYLELYNWMIAAGFPENFNQYKGMSPDNMKNRFAESQLISDATLIVHDSKMNPKTEITFIELFPVSIGELRFDTTMPDVNYIQTTAVFAYSRFNIRSI